MKKFLIIYVTLAGLLLCSCSKSYDEKLTGTCWENQDESIAYKYRMVCFGVEGSASYSYQLAGGKYERYELQYTYNEPNVKITFPDGSRFGNGYIEGAILHITDGGWEGTYKKTK